MINLFNLNMKDYTDDMPLIERYGVRAIIRRDGLLAMQKDRDGIYKIPGGGVEKDEDLINALIREVREETGLIVKKASIKEIGEVMEIRRDNFETDKKYIAHSLFYFCDVEEKVVDTDMTANEISQGYVPVWENLDVIIANNEKLQTEFWTIRDTQFLKWLRDNS